MRRVAQTRGSRGVVSDTVPDRVLTSALRPSTGTGACAGSSGALGAPTSRCASGALFVPAGSLRAHRSTADRTPDGNPHQAGIELFDELRGAAGAGEATSGVAPRSQRAPVQSSRRGAYSALRGDYLRVELTGCQTVGATDA